MFRLFENVTIINIVRRSLHNSAVYQHSHKTAEPQESPKKPESQRMADFRKKLRETTDIDDLGEQIEKPVQVKDEPFSPWPENTNPHTGEVNGPRGPEPTRYGDWERKGRVSDF